jgi:hypothetical protein
MKGWRKRYGAVLALCFAASGAFAIAAKSAVPNEVPSLPKPDLSGGQPPIPGGDDLTIYLRVGDEQILSWTCTLDRTLATFVRCWTPHDPGEPIR